MKCIKYLTLSLSLLTIVSCSDSDKKTVEEAINTPSPQTTFTAQTDGTTANAVIGQAQHGTCTLSNDRTYITYEKTDLSYQGHDSCGTDESSDGCGGSYDINFGVNSPALTRSPTGC